MSFEARAGQRARVRIRLSHQRPLRACAAHTRWPQPCPSHCTRQQLHQMRRGTIFSEKVPKLPSSRSQSAHNASPEQAPQRVRAASASADDEHPAAACITRPRLRHALAEHFEEEEAGEPAAFQPLDGEMESVSPQTPSQQVSKPVLPEVCSPPSASSPSSTLNDSPVQEKQSAPEAPRRRLRFKQAPPGGSPMQQTRSTASTYHAILVV